MCRAQSIVSGSTLRIGSRQFSRSVFLHVKWPARNLSIVIMISGTVGHAFCTWPDHGVAEKNFWSLSIDTCVLLESLKGEEKTTCNDSGNAV